MRVDRVGVGGIAPTDTQGSGGGHSLQRIANQHLGAGASVAFVRSSARSVRGRKIAVGDVGADGRELNRVDPVVI